ncbi:hypothetical protein BIW11_13419 [Tropilaelaps mercedesae]|uniref:Uncharacterized protein n=1 Tax=Tropilaelaps mercedesae TaxID=418985 RepID=A0A1V9X2H6_9ACAR|nr:hypothetical protein BIW11_13419 [Tropilaelaps mercedesae]
MQCLIGRLAMLTIFVTVVIISLCSGRVTRKPNVTTEIALCHELLDGYEDSWIPCSKTKVPAKTLIPEGAKFRGSSFSDKYGYEVARIFYQVKDACFAIETIRRSGDPYLKFQPIGTCAYNYCPKWIYRCKEEFTRALRGTMNKHG